MISLRCFTSFFLVTLTSVTRVCGCLAQGLNATDSQHPLATRSLIVRQRKLHSLLVAYSKRRAASTKQFGNSGFAGLGSAGPPTLPLPGLSRAPAGPLMGPGWPVGTSVVFIGHAPVSEHGLPGSGLCPRQVGPPLRVRGFGLGFPGVSSILEALPVQPEGSSSVVARGGP